MCPNYRLIGRVGSVGRARRRKEKLKGNAKGTRSDAAPTIKSSGCGMPKPELSELPAKSKKVNPL